MECQVHNHSNGDRSKERDNDHDGPTNPPDLSSLQRPPLSRYRCMRCKTCREFHRKQNDQLFIFETMSGSYDSRDARNGGRSYDRSGSGRMNIPRPPSDFSRDARPGNDYSGDRRSDRRYDGSSSRPSRGGDDYRGYGDDYSSRRRDDYGNRSQQDMPGSGAPRRPAPR